MSDSEFESKSEPEHESKPDHIFSGLPCVLKEIIVDMAIGCDICGENDVKFYKIGKVCCCLSCLTSFDQKKMRIYCALAENEDEYKEFLENENIRDKKCFMPRCDADVIGICIECGNYVCDECYDYFWREDMYPEYDINTPIVCFECANICKNCEKVLSEYEHLYTCKRFGVLCLGCHTRLHDDPWASCEPCNPGI